MNPTAFRVLGQLDLRQNGLNGVEGSELTSPSAIALDARGGELHLYVADTGNHRVLGWRDANSYQAGAQADIVLGQPNLRTSVPLAIGNGGLNAPLGVAVHPQTGNVYVADTDDHRVLRFPSPFENPGRVEPDRFYGQPTLASRSANAGGLSERSMNGPTTVAFDRAGNLWVADRGNHRVLRIPAAALDTSETAADLVLGQPSFSSAAANGGVGAVGPTGFNTPLGLAFDGAGALYVSDFTNARVLVFNAPQTTAQPANRVLGQLTFESSGAPSTPTASTLRGPVGLEVSAAGDLYVSIPLDHRVVVFNDVAQASAG
ncbi:MAG TPA: NHL repeat-containing protein, partial [Ramlibacter sp.]